LATQNHGGKRAPEVATGTTTFDHLRRRYGRRWELRETPDGLVTAEQQSKDGNGIRYLVALSAAELAGRIEAAEQVAP
jgi:hypothetical protein